MTVPFTYVVTHISSGIRYYGVRFAKNCHPDDLGKSYLSSSDILREKIISEGTDNFKFEVRKTFNTAEEACRWENKFLMRVKAAQSPLWFNRSNGAKSFYNKVVSEETKEKMRKPKSESHRRKLAKHLDKHRKIPEWTEDRKRKQSKAMKGNRNAAGTPAWNSGKVMPKRVCPHCEKSGGGSSMTRYHFDNCKLKETSC